jgi:hypothetical protein
MLLETVTLVNSMMQLFTFMEDCAIFNSQITVLVLYFFELLI